MKVKRLLSQFRSQAAFTMIELLIVIAILGILAVAVLAAINPVEQINRGRDTGSRSDAEQLLSAIDRFYAYKGYYPWVTNPNAELAAQTVEMDLTDTALWQDADACNVLDKLANGDDLNCEGTNELKRSYVNKVTESDYNHLQIFFTGDSADSVYVCFEPVSGAFKEDALARCGEAGAGLPSDLQGYVDSVCPTTEGATPLSCLP